MHPAFSVIFFTTLSGAGYGVLAWAAVASMLGGSRPPVLLASLALGFALSTIGLLSSLLHLGKPLRAWRAFSQWRTSWLSREGLMAMVTLLPLAALAWGLASAATRGTTGIALPIAALLLLACALATVVCTAMIYASLRPIPAWRHRSVVPVYLLFSLLTGGLLFAAVLAMGGGIGNLVGAAGIAGAILLAWIKRRYWRAIDRSPLPMTRGDAVGLPDRNVTLFERPHTEANYLTREMGFVLARKHSRRLRAIAVVLFAVLPALALLPVWALVHVDAAPWLAVAALSALAGAFVERWLFFAEARHLVTLYY